MTPFPADLFSLCITPVDADAWWTQWSLAPEILIPFLVALALYVRGARGRQGRMLALGGWALMAAALFSPLCRLAAGLVSAHMIQLALIAIVAPALLAAGGALPAMGAALRRDASSYSRAPLSVPAFAYGAAIWTWHAPPVYNAALAIPALHVAVMLTIVASAAWFCDRIVRANPSEIGAAILVLLVTMAHTGFLGALLTFAPEPLYRSDPLALAAWGLSAKADQQLAGLIMWAPSGLLYLGVALVLAMKLISPPTDMTRGSVSNEDNRDRTSTKPLHS